MGYVIYSPRPIYAVAISLLCVPFLVLCRKKPNLRESFTILAGVGKFLIVSSMLPRILDGYVYKWELIELLPGVGLALKADLLGCFFGLVASFLWIFTSMYSIGYMRALKEHSQTRYFSFFAIALSSTIGVAFAENFLTLYLFYEFLSLSTYPLVTHHQDEEARSAGRRYLAYLLGASLGLCLPAMVIMYEKANTLSFSPGGFLAGRVGDGTMGILMLMCLFGFAKAAVMPLHSWLPAAMVAPTPVSALLHAVAVVKAGAFSIVRVITEAFGLNWLSGSWVISWVYFFTSLTILGASFIALYQRDLKRLLAFSTVGQLSYIILGVAMCSPEGLKGGLLHLSMHAFGKITLFFAAGAIFVATGLKDIGSMEGLGRRMPITFSAFFLGSLSIIGLPPSGGFLSKWFLLLGSLKAHSTVLALVLALSSLLSGAYFMNIIYKAFFPKAPVPWQIKEAPLMCVLPLVITSLISLWLFLWPWPFLILSDKLVLGLFR